MVVAFSAQSRCDVSLVLIAANARTREILKALNMPNTSSAANYDRRDAIFQANLQPAHTAAFAPFALQNLPTAVANPAFIQHPCCNKNSQPMPSAITSLRRRAKALHRNLRGASMAARALASTDHPLLAHIIPVRRCNLACTYCNEFDDFSKPVPTEEMFRRIDKLGELGTAVVTISGGEPLLHPDLDDVIRRIRSNGMIAGLITNGYFLVAERIKRLNRAGLEWLQISIDNVNPDEVSKKSLKVLDKKLQLLAEHAEFHVNINSVVGGGISNPQDALTIGKRAIELGFSSTIGIIHDGSGQLQPLGGEERRIYHEMQSLEKQSFTRINAFQDNIAQGLPNEWRCRAGARYLYICEDGLVHYCSQQRGYPGVPLATYTREDLRREYLTEKSCAPHCTVSCVHQVSIFDGWRAPQHPAPLIQATEPAAELVQIR
jgi:MoaA/NifB/PqqE/SkfB family radical SAM enzyme